ncbi:hypothetical protein MFIFM68171_04739 [Madurella fahalii]|uniref:Uncharacterized protein n=1 Tax=Madurella fahalii TaxID=1157608 RepID=A0ABQ0G9U8_9PEZI
MAGTTRPAAREGPPSISISDLLPDYGDSNTNNNTILPNQQAAPSHQYDQYKQQTSFGPAPLSTPLDLSQEEEPTSPVQQMFTRIIKKKRSRRPAAQETDGTSMQPVGVGADAQHQAFEMSEPPEPVELDSHDMGNDNETEFGVDNTQALSQYKITRRILERQLQGPVPTYTPTVSFPALQLPVSMSSYAQATTASSVPQSSPAFGSFIQSWTLSDSSLSTSAYLPAFGQPPPERDSSKKDLLIVCEDRDKDFKGEERLGRFELYVTELRTDEGKDVCKGDTRLDNTAAIPTETKFISLLLSYQRYDGSIEFKDWATAEKHLGKEIADALRDMHTTRWSRLKYPIVKARALWTAAVHVLLERDFQACKSLWELMAIKPESYCQKLNYMAPNVLEVVKEKLDGLKLSFHQQKNEEAIASAKAVAAETAAPEPQVKNTENTLHKPQREGKSSSALPAAAEEPY